MIDRPSRIDHWRGLRRSLCPAPPPTISDSDEAEFLDGVALFGELDFPTLRPSFVLTGISTTPVFRANDVATVFGLGLIARVP